MRLWFGKHRGLDITDVPDSYLVWLADNMQSDTIREIARDELDRRRNPKRRDIDTQDRMVRELIEAGYRSLARKFHPDLGGDTTRMQQLNAAMEKLRQ